MNLTYLKHHLTPFVFIGHFCYNFRFRTVNTYNFCRSSNNFILKFAFNCHLLLVLPFKRGSKIGNLTPKVRPEVVMESYQTLAFTLTEHLLVNIYCRTLTVFANYLYVL